MDPITAVMVGSSIVSGISGIFKGRKQRRLAQERARQKQLQREEIARRTQSEIELLKFQAEDTVGSAMTQYVGAGIDVSSGASTQARMASFENLGRVIMNKRWEAEFRSEQLDLEARWEIKQGKALAQGSVIDAIGGLVDTGVSIYRGSGGGKQNG